MMVRTWLHWCPNGCGKSVVYEGGLQKRFTCTRCKVKVATSLEELKSLKCEKQEEPELLLIR